VVQEEVVLVVQLLVVQEEVVLQLPMVLEEVVLQLLVLSWQENAL
jgi:hypothetical protein